MKSKKVLLSVLSVAVLCAALLGILFTGAAAEENVVLYAVGDLEVQGALQADSIQDALADLEKNSRKWDANTTAEIRIQGNDHSGGAQDGVIFGQATIWREDGTKLPIKILGVDTALSRDAYIYLDGAGGWYACANDYTFENLTLPVGDQKTFFFAGSGDVKLVNCALTSGGNLTVETVQDRTNVYMNCRETAIAICADAKDLIIPDLGRLPCGDAWQAIRTSAEYHATGTVKTDKNGDAYVDKDLTGKDGSAYGDYSHAGNTGGGQYLNACVYYEAILGLECKDNPWRPTAYTLDESLVPILQKAAHDAVVAVYGEDHFKTPIDADIDNDGVINLLMMGSSSSYYMRDELHLMARHIGIDLRVVHAYSSGIKMSTQWSWAKNGTGKWTVYTEWDGKTSSGVQNQKLSDYVEDYPWDVIVTYQTGGAFNKKNLGSGYSEETLAKAMEGCSTADDFINFVYSYNNNANANARYFWFQTVGAPVGAPGPGGDAKGFIYGDNCTSAVYAGWTDADLARYTKNGKLAASSITLGDGTEYNGNISPVGYLTTAPAETYTHESAKTVKFIDGSGFENYEIPEVLPVNTVGTLVVDGATVGAPKLHSGHSPASCELRVKKGRTSSITLCDQDTVTRYGDVTVRFTGGTIKQFDVLYYSKMIGDLKIYMDESDGTAEIEAMLRLGFTDNKIDGDVILDVKGGTIGGSVYPGGAVGTGTIYNSFSNCTLKANFYGARTGAAGRIVNTFKNCTVSGNYYGGHYNATTLLTVENYIEGTTFEGEFHGGSRTTGKISGGEVTIDGKKEEVSIYNKISGSTFNSAFYGGNGENANVASTLWNDIGEGNTFVGRYYAGGTGYVKGPITNRINGDSVFKDNFYGSTSSKTAGDVITEVSGNPIFEGTFSAMGYDASVEDSEGKTLTTKISGGTFKGKAYLSGQMLRNRVSYVTVTGGIFDGNTYFGGYNSLAKEINSTIKGGIFNKAVYGGNCDGGENVNAEKVNTVIEGGTFNSSFYGASRGYVTGEVHTTVKGGTFNGTYYGGGYGKDAGDATSIGAITNEISGGIFNADYYGGSAYYTVESVTNKISGGTFKNVTGKNADGDTVSLHAFYGGSKGGSVTGNVTNVISGGTFDCHAIFGSVSPVGGSVINTISGGTFALTSCGAGKGEISGNVENTISGTAEFKKGFYCGYGLKESSATKITGNMINKVQPGPTEKLPYFGRAPEYNLSKDGTVDSFYNIGNSDFGYMGGGNNSTISGYVENEISGGYFYGHWHGANNNGSVKGKNADGDGIVNKISGGTFAYRAYGGMVSPTTLTGNIRNEITGGLFKYEFAASHRAGAKTLTTTTYSHDIYTHISGDPVFEKYVCGVARGWNTEQSARVRLLGKAVLTIEGGTFKGDIYGLCNNGGYYSAAMPGARIDDGGSVTVNINGGTFSGQIYATSPTFDATLYHENGLATVKIAPTKGDVTLQKAVASRFANEVFTIGGGDKKLVLASDAAITASSYDGKALELHRADGWTKGTTYLTLPTAEINANITATKGEGAKGDLKTVVNGTETRWIGMDSTGVYGVNLILEQKIGLRLWLNKAEVDAIGEDFTYEITSEGKTLAAGSYAELATKAEVKKQGETEYYTLVLGSLEPASFHKAILFGGNGLDPASYSINDILGIVITNENSAFNEGFVTLAKSLWNYGIEAYDRFSGETSALTKQTLSAPADAQIIASATDGSLADAKLVGRALVLREAVGLRVYLNLQNGVKAEDLTFTLNGTELGKELLYIREESGNGYNVSVTVYVTAAAMNRTLNLSITMDGEAVGSYTDSIASVCQQYREAGGKDSALCTAILRYIQAVPGMND